MKKVYLFILGVLFISAALVSFKADQQAGIYVTEYKNRLNDFKWQQQALLSLIAKTDVENPLAIAAVKNQINRARIEMKSMDFWFRYLDPLAYKKINGPLPVEWETEVFEKFEQPYKRAGAGLSLAALYLEAPDLQKDSLFHLIQASVSSTVSYAADSIVSQLGQYHHFYLCNRLFLLNLAAIYTTGFECPDSSRIIPELQQMLNSVQKTYNNFNADFPATPLPPGYLELFQKMTVFAGSQPADYSGFDNFNFIRKYVNPLFAINQQCIREYGVLSKSFVDYSLNKNSHSIFSKDLYTGQNSKGVFLRVKDEKVLIEIEKLGKLLFYDPILSGNNKRSCASCHKANVYFTDTSQQTSLQFNQQDYLPRNTPSLINAEYNHLLMLDGKHISLQNQARDVITNPLELGEQEESVMKKILSCPDYKKGFENLLPYTPQETAITLEHISSAITFYFSKFSKQKALFDDLINNPGLDPDEAVHNGFNLFMSKAQCATCHFVPHFNGVKPPYVGSEFEVLGVPIDTLQKLLSPDKGRFNMNPAVETLHAFRTGTLRNAALTAPYMHNGVFSTLEQVIDFYDAGGGAGKGITNANQTLSSDSLHLTPIEKKQLISFIQSLNENIEFDAPPENLPRSRDRALNTRKPGGIY